MRTKPAAAIIDQDPVSALIAALRTIALDQGIVDIRPHAGLIDDDGIFDIPVDLAFAPTGLLPVIVESGRLVYGEAWMDRASGQPFAFGIQNDDDGMLGLKVVVVPGSSVEIGILCCTDALSGYIDRAPVKAPVMWMQA